MTEWLGMPPLASAHGGQIDSLIGWIHIFMLLLFVGWGGFFLYTLVRFRKSRNPVADYRGVTSHRSTYLEIGVAVVEAVLLIGFAIPLWATRVDAQPPANETLVVQVTGEQFAWNMHYPGPDRVFGRTDVTLLDLQSNPLGLDRTDPAAQDDVTIGQSALPAGEPAGHREAQEQGSHPQLRRARVSSEAGRHSRVDHPDLVRPHRHDRGDADPHRESRLPVPRSPARSCAAWAMPGCAASSPSRPPRNSRSGWTKRSQRRRRRRLTPSGRTIRTDAPGSE